MVEEEFLEDQIEGISESLTSTLSQTEYAQIDEPGQLEDPRVVWILERIMAYFQTEDKSLITRMLNRNDSRAHKKLYRVINEEGSDYKRGFYVYQTQFGRRYKRNVKYMKIRVRENEVPRYRCFVETDVKYHDEIFTQLHLHFDLHRWQRFPHKGKIIYFLPRQNHCPPFETIREAQAMMPKMFYVGQIDITSIRNFRTLFTAMQEYIKQIFINPTNPMTIKKGIPSTMLKSKGTATRPSIFEIENSSSYMKKMKKIENFFISEEVTIYPTFNMETFQRLEPFKTTKKRDKTNVYSIDDFLKPETFAKNPKLRSLWHKKKRGPIPKLKDRSKIALNDTSFPKSKFLSVCQKLINDFDWCFSKVSQCTLHVLFTDFLATLDIKKFDNDEKLKAKHMTFLKGVLEIWTLHIKNLLKCCGNVSIKGKGVIALYEYYKERRDKISNLIFEMFHPIVENLLSFVSTSMPSLVVEFKEMRGQLENFYIICWDTCEYLEFCLHDLETIQNHKLLRPIVKCSERFLGVLKMLLALSFYWRSNNRFLDILHRLHFVIQSKIEKMLNTDQLFRLPNRISIALCKDIIHVSEFWQSTVEQDRDFSQKINFEQLMHLRDVAQSILEILRIMKSYNHVYCQNCYDAESENYKLDAVVYEVKQLTSPLISPGFNYLDVDNKLQWAELVNEFKKRCSDFNKEAALLIVDAIRKTKKTRNIANILMHFKISTKQFKMDELFDDIFSNLDISPQFSQEILQILEVFLKACYYKDSMRSFGYASKSMQWTRCLFYVVQKNLSILFTIGSVLPNVYDKIITNYFRCVDVFTSYEVGLYKVWLKRFVNYTHNVVSKKLIQLAYEKDVAGDEDGCLGFFSELFDKNTIANCVADSSPPNQNAYSKLKQLSSYLPQFRPYLMDALQEENLEKLASLHSCSSHEGDIVEDDTQYKKSLMLKYKLDLDNWYTERYMLNYNFVTKLALGLCTENDEQLEANVYFLLEQTMKSVIEQDDKIVRKYDRSRANDVCNYFQTYDCCSSSGSVTRISELLTENSLSLKSVESGLEGEVNKFFVDRDPVIIQKITDLSQLKNDNVPLFIAIREHFKEKVDHMLGGNTYEGQIRFTAKTKEVTAADPESSCSEDFPFPKHLSPTEHLKQASDAEDIDKYKVLFKTPINHLYNYKELAFVLWLNNTKLKFVKPEKPEKDEEHKTKLNDPMASSPDYDKRLSDDNEWDRMSFKATQPKLEQRKQRRRRYKREVGEKYDCPMNDIFENEENNDRLFRKTFNLYLTKLINDSNQPGQSIEPNEISGRIHGSLLPDGTRDAKSAFLYEVTDDDMPDQKIGNEINYILQSLSPLTSKPHKSSSKKELQDAIKQADLGMTSESEKAMHAIDYENEIRKTIPGIYTGCKHSLGRTDWSSFIGGDILKEHGYTIQANREPFTYVACRDIETLEEFGFALPAETLAFAFNNFDRNKQEIFEIVTLYKSIIGRFSEAQLMALKPYIRPVERDICQGLSFCGLRTLNITNQCQELIVQMNRLAIVHILMTEVEESIREILHTIGRLNFYRMPSKKSLSVKDFFDILNKNVSHTQRRLNKLYKLIPQKLLKLETLLYQQRSGKCEYMIMYYRCVEKMLFKKLITMLKANLGVFRRFVMGEVKSRFHVTASIVEPIICVQPELKMVSNLLTSLSNRVIRNQKQMPRWFDGTCSKVPHLKKRDMLKNSHMYSFSEDLLGSEEVVGELQVSYECISYVLDAVDDYICRWGRFEHLWIDEMDDVFTKFSLDKPSLQDFFDIFKFYHQIIVEIYKMPDYVDIYCVRIKIKEIKKKVLLYALSWRAFTQKTLNNSIAQESQELYRMMQNSFMALAEKVTSFHSLRQVLKSCYDFYRLEIATDILLSNTIAKSGIIKMWIPQHMHEESNFTSSLVHNIKLLKKIALYRRELLSPYLSKITPRLHCIQCSPGSVAVSESKFHEQFPIIFQTTMKELDFGQSLKICLLNLIEEVESIKDTCSWAVVDLTLEHMREGLKMIELFKLLHPKVTVQKLQNAKTINKLLGFENLPKEKSEISIEAMLQLLR